VKSRTLLFLCALTAAPAFSQEALKVDTQANATGTHGDVILEGDTARATGGVVLRAKSTRPDVVVETGSTSGTAGFAIFSSAGAELWKFRNDGLVVLGGSTPSNWHPAIMPALEYKSTSLHFGSSTEIRLLSNMYVPASVAEFQYKSNLPTASYTIWNGYHLFTATPAGAPNTAVPYSEVMRMEPGPKVSIGNYGSNFRFHVSGSSLPMAIDAVNSYGFGIEFRDLLPEGAIYGVLMEMKGNSFIRVGNMQFGYMGTPVINSNGASNPLLLNTTSPNDVVIGQSSYTTKLVVAGTGTSSFAGGVSVAGNVNVTGTITGASVIGARYQDLAEWVPSESDLEAGTVVVLSREHANAIAAAEAAYDTSVAGVVSDRPGIILGEGSDEKEMVATTGRVRVKVDATRHPIAIGDLLVSSDRPGRAMKSIPVEIGGTSFHRPGTIIGKALEPLAGGEGEILVLLSLQ
jgi:hypothetical protein